MKQTVDHVVLYSEVRGRVAPQLARENAVPLPADESCRTKVSGRDVLGDDGPVVPRICGLIGRKDIVHVGTWTAEQLGRRKTVSLRTTLRAWAGLHLAHEVRRKDAPRRCAGGLIGVERRERCAWRRCAGEAVPPEPAASDVIVTCPPPITTIVVFALDAGHEHLKRVYLLSRPAHAAQRYLKVSVSRKQPQRWLVGFRSPC